MRKLLIALGLTVAVTAGASAAEYKVVITHLPTNHKMDYRGKVYPSEEACKKAIGNWPEVLAALPKLDTDPNVDIPEPKAEEPLNSNIALLTLQLMQNGGGRAPRLGISCEASGQPA